MFKFWKILYALGSMKWAPQICKGKQMILDKGHWSY